MRCPCNISVNNPEVTEADVQSGRCETGRLRVGAHPASAVLVPAGMPVALVNFVFEGKTVRHRYGKTDILRSFEGTDKGTGYPMENRGGHVTWESFKSGLVDL